MRYPEHPQTVDAHTIASCSPQNSSAWDFIVEVLINPNSVATIIPRRPGTKKIRAEGFVDATVGPSAILEIDDSFSDAGI